MPHIEGVASTRTAAISTAVNFSRKRDTGKPKSFDPTWWAMIVHHHEWGKAWCTKNQFHHSKQAKFATNCGGISVTMPCMQVLAEKMQPEAALASRGHWGTRQGPCCHGLVIFIFFYKNCLPLSPCAAPKKAFQRLFLSFGKQERCFEAANTPQKSQNVCHYHPQPLEKAPTPFGG